MKLLRPPRSEAEVRTFAYNPRTHRHSGGNGRKHLQWFRVIALLSATVGLDWYRHGPVYSFISSRSLSETLTTQRLRAGGQRSAEVNQAVEHWREKADPRINEFCRLNSFAEASDIRTYSRMSDALLAKIANARTEIPRLPRTERARVFNSLVAEAQKASEFFNQKLVKCFQTRELAMDVTRQAAAIHNAIEELRRQI